MIFGLSKSGIAAVLKFWGFIAAILFLSAGLAALIISGYKEYVFVSIPVLGICWFTYLVYEDFK